MGTNLGYCLYLIGHVLRRIETVFLRVKEQANEREKTDAADSEDAAEPSESIGPVWWLSQHPPPGLLLIYLQH